METFEIRDKSIDSEKIRQEIRQRIEKRRAQGVYDALIDDYFTRKVEDAKLPSMQIGLADLDELMKMDIHYDIVSHRPGLVAAVVIFFKEIIRAIIALPLKPLYDRQTNYNKLVKRYLQRITERIERIELERQLRIDGGKNKSDGN